MKKAVSRLFQLRKALDECEQRIWFEWIFRGGKSSFFIYKF